jgi:hypothetical protein
LLIRIFSIIFFFILLQFQLSIGGDFFWPTDASNLLTSTFAEHRPGHFHSGIDIKTWAREGYKIFAVDSGSIIKIRVSPYGYGRAIYLLLDVGLIVVYGHLSQFSPAIENIIKEEQNRLGKYALEKYFDKDSLRIQKGELIGFTGSSGTGVPHLHFEVRDHENRPFNPLYLGYYIKDTTPPTLLKLAVTPLSYRSHVNGDFQPKIFLIEQEKDGKYLLNEKITGWGKLGLSINTFDIADGARNKLAVYETRLFIDDRLVYYIRYNRFSYMQAHFVDLDRDYRLNKRKLGIFQKLYREEYNELSFYEPYSRETGVIICSHEGQNRMDIQKNGNEYSYRQSNPVILSDGDHKFYIEVKDYAGNTSVVSGMFQLYPLTNIKSSTVISNPYQNRQISQKENFENISFKKQIYDEYIRFSVQTDIPFEIYPRLCVDTNNWFRSYIPLYLNEQNAYIGTLGLDTSIDGLIISEFYYKMINEPEQVICDTMEIFTITREKETSIFSQDHIFYVNFPVGAVYKKLFAAVNRTPFSYNTDIFSHKYDIIPDEIPLCGKIQVLFCVSHYKEENEKNGVYEVMDDGSVSFIGNGWDKNRNAVFGWAEDLGSFAVIQDTVPPEILSVFPAPDMKMSVRTPKISVCFKDTLSGIYGEDNYIIKLDGKPLIIEYDPENDIGFHQIHDPLDPGEHLIEIVIKDRSGNIAEMNSRFSVHL